MALGGGVGILCRVPARGTRAPPSPGGTLIPEMSLPQQVVAGSPKAGPPGPWGASGAVPPASVIRRGRMTPARPITRNYLTNYRSYSFMMSACCHGGEFGVAAACLSRSGASKRTLGLGDDSQAWTEGQELWREGMRGRGWPRGMGGPAESFQAWALGGKVHWCLHTASSCQHGSDSFPGDLELDKVWQRLWVAMRPRPQS